MAEQKKTNLKISKTCMRIGAIILIIGVLILSISLITYFGEKKSYDAQADAKYNQAIEEYNREFDEWREAWMNNSSSAGDMPVRPSRMTSMLDGPKIPMFVIFISGVLIIGGGSLLGYGLMPYIAKFSLKHKKEMLDYTGEDITNVGTKIVDIGAPVINKAVDDVLAPSVKKIKNAVTSDSADEAKVFCKHCGTQIDADSKFCSNCGKEQ